MSRHPYREPPTEKVAERDGDERAIYLVTATVGAIPMTIAAASGARFGVEPTLGLVMFGLGVVGLVSTLRWH